jgi:hypothetical protein
MSVSYAGTLKDTRMNAVITACDSNASPGTLEIGTAGMATVLVIITLAKPSWTEAAGVITLAGIPRSGVASTTGTAAAARFKDGGGGIQISGLTVGTSGTDITLNNTAISSGQTVTINSGTITHSP